jgi:hypothetical protein
MNTFSGLCIGACIFIIFIGMAAGVVNSIGAFPGAVTPTADTTDAQQTGNFSSYSNIYSLLTTYGGAIGLGVIASIITLLITGSTSLIGIWMFAAVFWSSWLSIQNIFYTGGFLNNETGILIVLMLWFGMSMMFIGAVVGMLSPGSTAMR